MGRLIVTQVNLSDFLSFHALILHCFTYIEDCSYISRHRIDRAQPTCRQFENMVAKSKILPAQKRTPDHSDWIFQTQHCPSIADQQLPPDHPESLPRRHQALKQAHE